MGFKELQRFVQSSEQGQQPEEMKILLEKLRNKAFYYWGRGKTAGHKASLTTNCCFNHIIGLPKKDNKEYPLFDYELMVFRSLMEDTYLNSRLDIGVVPAHTFAERQARRELLSKAVYADFKCKHVAILKAAGLGITEFVLRWILWMCMKNDNLKGSQVVIFTGPRLQLAITLIERLKGLLKSQNVVTTDKETVLNINGVRIEAFPSFHSDSARGLPNISIIFADELAFFPPHEIDNIMDIMLRNIPKSNPHLIAVSTANKPGDAMERIMKEPFETSVWKDVYLDYTYGVGKIYSEEDIAKIKGSRSFDREYRLQFSGVQGNVISPTAIDRCVLAGDATAASAILDNWNIDCKYVMSLDPSWGSSNFAVIVSRFINGKVQILHAHEHERPNFSDMISEIWRLKRKCAHLQNIIIDSANTEIYTALCHEFKQNPSLQYLHDKQAYVKKTNQMLEDHLFIAPVPFSTQGQPMLAHLKWLIEETDDDGNAMVQINSRFDKLITSLRTAQATENKLDKEATVHDDLFDSMRLNLSFYRMAK